MWNMRRRHSSHSCQPAAAEPSVKADQREPRSGRSEAESLYGRRSGGYTRVSAPGCLFRPLALCFQQVPRVAATGYSRSNREQPISRATSAFLAGYRRSNHRQPCSTRAGVTCHHSCRCRRQRRSLISLYRCTACPRDAVLGDAPVPRVTESRMTCCKAGTPAYSSFTGADSTSLRSLPDQTGQPHPPHLEGPHIRDQRESQSS